MRRRGFFKALAASVAGLVVVGKPDPGQGGIEETIIHRRPLPLPGAGPGTITWQSSESKTFVIDCDFATNGSPFGITSYRENSCTPDTVILNNSTAWRS